MHIARPTAGTGGRLSLGPSYFPICHLAIGMPSCLTNARLKHEEITSVATLLLPLPPPAALSRLTWDLFFFSTLFISKSQGSRALAHLTRR